MSGDRKEKCRQLSDQDLAELLTIGGPLTQLAAAEVIAERVDFMAGEEAIQCPYLRYRTELPVH